MHLSGAFRYRRAILMDYYNNIRTHLSLKAPPLGAPSTRSDASNPGLSSEACIITVRI